jgi:hypothetical protein
MLKIWDPVLKEWDISNLKIAFEANRSGLFYTYIPPSGEITLKSQFPFEMGFFLSINTQPEIQLYAQYSKSAPFQNPQTKWAHLLPQWRFFDENHKLTDVLKPTYTILYDSENKPLGVYGIAKFYFSDDLPTDKDCPLYIWATIDTFNLSAGYDLEKKKIPGYANSLLTISLPYHINGQVPEILEISRNGENDFFDLNWLGIQMPYVMRLRGNYLNDICPYAQTPIIFDYPQEGVDASANLIHRNYYHTTPLTPFDLNQQTWDPVEQVFQRYDEYNRHIGGFVRGTGTSHISSSLASISASVNIDYYEYFRDYSLVWIANPENNTVNVVQFFPQRGENCEESGSQIKIPHPTIGEIEINPIESHFTSFGVPYITETSDPMALTGFGGIFGIAATPCYDAWFADAEMDALFKYDSSGNQLKAIYLKEIPGITALDTNIASEDTGLTPAGISLDSELNIWVTLFDYVSALKFDNNGEFLFATKPTNATLPPRFENTIYKGPQVDTDSQNNVWVTYSNYPNSALVKYDTSGNILHEVIITSPSATPIDILINGADDSLWVCNAFSHHLSGNIQHYSSEGILLSTWELPYWPSYLTIDDNKNIWFTYGYNLVGKITPPNLNILSYTVSASKFIENTGLVSDVPEWFDLTERLDTTALGGIACDMRNRIWVINSQENRVYIANAENTNFNKSVYIIPNANISWNNDTGANNIQQYAVYDWWYQSAQAFGDWTAYRWFQKYYQVATDELQTATLTAVSNEFKILPFEQPFCIRRFNESWDAAQIMHDLVLSEHMHENFNLWQNYLGSMVGGMRCDEQSLGRQSYEKIANFSNDHINIDTVGHHQLYSIMDAMDIPYDNYKFEYPANIKRLLDIFTVPHHQLWGARCKCNKHFNNNSICDRCNHQHASNIGPEFNMSTYMITAGMPFLAKFIYGDSYQVITPGPSAGNILIYPFTESTHVDWVSSDQYQNYRWFEWEQTYCNTQTDGVINWSDEYTTLSEYTSSIEEWYGDNGLIENMLMYELFRGLDIGTPE